jgi:hypothetical protein
MKTLRITPEMLAAAEECRDHEGDYVRAFVLGLARAVVAQSAEPDHEVATYGGTGICPGCRHVAGQDCRCDDKPAQPRADASGCPGCGGQFSSSVCAHPQHYTSEPASREAQPAPAEPICNLLDLAKAGVRLNRPINDQSARMNLPADQPPKLARLERMLESMAPGLLTSSILRILQTARLDFADALAAAHRRAEFLIDEADATARRTAAARQADQKKIAGLEARLETARLEAKGNLDGWNSTAQKLGDIWEALNKMGHVITRDEPIAPAVVRIVRKLTDQLAEAQASVGN